MLALLELMKRGFESVVNGKLARLSMLRCKNKMGKQDPTRFRNLLVNLILTWDGCTTITELQVHHSKILAYNDHADGHGPYNFFRSLFAGATLDGRLNPALAAALHAAD